MSKISNRVVVALSGGVDSSVAAFLLKQQGFDVIGVSLKVWDYEDAQTQKAKTCCSYNDIQDARSVCEAIGVPFYAFNYKKDFQKKVIDTFVSEYSKGRTPNPCILCNYHVKFDQLLNEAEKLGASYLATGHHARLTRDADGLVHLIKGIDEAKDQSYVLYRLTQTQLQKILFPVGNYTKDEIRKIAMANGLPTANKPESQDICFIPNRDHAAFIKKNYPEFAHTNGNFINDKGEIIGTHKGIHAYTVGQRRGLGIGFGKRMYVKRIDSQKNEVELAEATQLSTQGLIADQVNWVLPFQKIPSEFGVKIRYQKDEIFSKLHSTSNHDEVTIHFKEEPNVAVSPGQSAVFYHGDEVLGGGWIQKSIVDQFSC